MDAVDEIASEIRDKVSLGTEGVDGSTKTRKIFDKSFRGNIFSLAMTSGMLVFLLAEISSGGLDGTAGFVVGFASVFVVVGLLTVVALVADRRDASRRRAEAFQVLTLLLLMSEGRADVRTSPDVKAALASAIASSLPHLAGITPHMISKLMGTVR